MVCNYISVCSQLQGVTAADKLQINTATYVYDNIISCTIQTVCVLTLTICFYNDIDNNFNYRNILNVQ